MPSETAPRTAHDLLDAILAPTGEVATDVLRPAVREHTRERPRVDSAGFTRTGVRLAELDEHGGIRADAVGAVPR